MARNRIIALLLILMVATFIRLHRLDAQSLWSDEGNSARITERSTRLIVEAAAGDIHPPFYYLALTAWSLAAGRSEFSLRFLSAAAGIITVALCYAIANRLADVKVGLMAALLTALNPLQAYYSQEARMYALLGALAAGSIYVFLLWLRTPTRNRGLALMAINGLGLYTHYAYPIVMAIEGVVLLLWIAVGRDRAFKVLAGWLAINTASFISFSPWMTTAWRQTTTWPKTGVPFELWDAIEAMWGRILAGKMIRQSPWLPHLGAVLLLIGLFPSGRPSLRRLWAKVPVLTWGSAPIVAVLALNLYRESFMKFLIVAEPAFAIWMAFGIRQLTKIGPRVASVILASGALTAMILGSANCLDAMYTDPMYFRADYRGIAHMIEANARPGDAVITDAANQWEVFTYYHRDGAPVYPLPRSRPLNVEATQAELADILRIHDRIYTLYWGEREADPDGVIERYLLANAFEVSSRWYGDVRLVIYISPAAPPDRPSVEANALFGESIRLVGYWIGSLQASPGDYLAVTLFWQAVRPSEARYKVFLHLLGPDGQLTAQRDSEPMGGTAPTSTWLPGETVMDNHGLILPSDSAYGSYRLVLGLYPTYDPSTRLPITVDGRAMGDTLLLAEIEVIPSE